MKASFTSRKKGGKLWILHNGVAVNKLPPFTTAQEAIKILKETRGHAVSYAFGIDSEDCMSESCALASFAKELDELDG